ncbi:SRPBCC family protein [Nakamurella lactea]|uniref:SRPBCC family protein n=1 Tax=Nakamurella lactea TaxID=459515 RepID=UPI00041D3784|nr:SRPBCC family protein [Nakamurella lactea]
MDLQHHFTVPATIEDTWAAFNDLQRIGGCLPGATITSVDGDDFTGTVKVKLGPISLQYNGTGSYTERDEAARRVVIVAKGKDKRGNGTASATITAKLVADGSGTAVDVDTDLSITGKPAQFGRGVIQDVSDQLLGQFVDCIKDKLTPAPAAAAESAAAGSGAAGSGAAGSGVAGSGAAFPLDDSPLPPAATDTLAPSELPTAKAPSAERTEPAETDGGAGPAAATAGSGAAPSSGATSGPVSGPPAAEIDLMSTVGPVLIKRYAKPVVGVLAVLGLILVLRRLFGGSAD